MIFFTLFNFFFLNIHTKFHYCWSAIFVTLSYVTKRRNKMFHLTLCNIFCLWLYGVKQIRTTRSEMQLRGKSVRSWCDGLSDRSFMGWTHWAISRSSQCSATGVTKAVICAVCGMVHIKEPLLLIGKSSLCGGSGLSFSLSEWSLTICLMPYNR